MPHLAPLPWSSVPILLWLVVSLLSASTWWHQTAQFSHQANYSSYPQTKWTWKCPANHST